MEKQKGVINEATKTCDAIEETLRRLGEQNLSSETTDTVLLLMKLSYRFGLLKEAYDQIVLKRLFENDDD